MGVGGWKTILDEGCGRGGRNRKTEPEGMEATLKWGAVRKGTAAHINLVLLLNVVWS